MKEKENVVGPKLHLDHQKFKKLAVARNVLRAVNHKLRQRILGVISEYDEINVTDLYIKLRLEQAVVSQHLAILLESKIVNTKRQGRFIFYSINYGTIEKINQIVKELSTDWITIYWRPRELYTPFFATCNIDIFI